MKSTEKYGVLQLMESKRDGHDWATGTTEKSYVGKWESGFFSSLCFYPFFFFASSALALYHGKRYVMWQWLCQPFSRPVQWPWAQSQCCVTIALPGSEFFHHPGIWTQVFYLQNPALPTPAPQLKNLFIFLKTYIYFFICCSWVSVEASRWH